MAVRARIGCEQQSPSRDTDISSNVLDAWWSERGQVSFLPVSPKAAAFSALHSEHCEAAGSLVADLSREEQAVVATLRLWYAGATAQALMELLNLSPQIVLRSLQRCESLGLVERSVETPPHFHHEHRRVTFWLLAETSEAVEALRLLPFPSLNPSRGFTDCGVPPEFWYLFWSGIDPEELRLPQDAMLVGCRIMESFSSEGRSWVLSHFTRQQLEECLERYPNPDAETPTLIRQALNTLA